MDCSLIYSCKHIFIDVGANIGMHARFLFEPRNYPQSIFSKKFVQLLSLERNLTCAIEIEPNPMHKKRHFYLKRYYNSIGLKYIYIPMGVGNGKNTTYYLNPTIRGGVFNEQWSFGIKNREKNLKQKSYNIQTLDMSDIINCKRYTKGKTIIKMDIEGQEYTVVSNLLMRG